MLLAEFTGREENPVVPTLSLEDEQLLREKVGEHAVENFYAERAKVLFEMANDPLRKGHRPPIWKIAEEQLATLRQTFPVGVIQFLILGGNRASKTVFAAWKVMQILVARPNRRAWCLQSTEAASRADQQGLIYDMIPPEWRPQDGRTKGRHKTTKINYTDAGGFTENTFVLPNGSQCWFKFYGADVKTVEGAELDVAWPDELVTPDWLEALRFRLITRNGLLLLTFTPAQGYSATVAEFLDDAQTLATWKGELLPEGEQVIPRLLQCHGEKTKNARVIHFYTEDNVHGNYPAMKVELAGSSTGRIKMRAYGIAEKTHAAQLYFKENVHVISANRVFEFFKSYKSIATRYHLVDPCSGRPWFMHWYFCIPGKVIIYREWPSHGHAGAHIQGYGDLGPWAVSGDSPDGKKGPAQEPIQFGLARYVDETWRQEAGETIFERWIDARYSNAPKTEREGTTTLIEQLADEGMNFIAMTSEQKILGTPDGSIDMINGALDFDKHTPLGKYSPRLSKINEPTLLVSELCPNTIYALKNWTGIDGQWGACKDPIDLIRGFFLSRLGHVLDDEEEVGKGGCY